MPSNKPAALALQMDRCDVCGNKIHRRDLVRTQVEYLIPEAENYFLYSSYNTAYWTVDSASDAGLISYGNRADRARTQVPIDQPTAAGDMSVVNGVQTWTGDGTFRSFVLTPGFTPRTAVTVSAVVGPHMENTSPEMTVSMGITNSDGSVKQEIRSWTIKGMTRVWFTELAQTLNDYGLGGLRSFYFYFQITNDGDWWIDELQIEANTPSDGVTVADPADYRPGIFKEVSGAYSGPTADHGGIASRKVCPHCFEYVFKKSQIYGRTDEIQTDYPVDDFSQEF